MADKLPKGGAKSYDEDNNDAGNETEKEVEETESSNDEASEKDIIEKEEEVEEEIEILDEEPEDKSDDEKEKSDDEKEDDVPHKKIKDDDETCLYKIGRKEEKFLDVEDIDSELFEDDKIVLTGNVVKPEDRITKPILTKYERVRLLSERRQQLVLGAKPMIKLQAGDNISEKDISSLELKHKVIPFIIVRTLPNGNIEHWKLSELEIIN